MWTEGQPLTLAPRHWSLRLCLAKVMAVLLVLWLRHPQTCDLKTAQAPSIQRRAVLWSHVCG